MKGHERQREKEIRDVESQLNLVHSIQYRIRTPQNQSSAIGEKLRFNPTSPVMEPLKIAQNKQLVQAESPSLCD